MRVKDKKLDKDIIQAIKRYIEKHGYPPTIKEISETVNCCKSTVHEHVKDLVAEGRLETDHGACTPRAIRVPNMVITYRRFV